MNAILIKNDLHFVGFKMKRKEIYLFSESVTHELTTVLKRDHLLQNIEVKDISYFFKSFLLDADKKNVFIIRSGGIGDLIALSSLALFLTQEKGKQVTFITQPKYKALFSWFTAPVKFHDYMKPVAKNTIEFKFNKNRSQLNFEGKIENTTDNWFHIFYKYIDTQNFDFGRPYLCFDDKTKNQPSNIPFNNGILLTLKATANIRSIQLEAVYTAITQSNNTIEKIYVHESNLSADDKKFIAGIIDSRLQIIQAKRLNEFLLDVANARQVISTDTGALHFREGIERKAIGLYAPFSAECRTQYYKHTQSFNLQSNCAYQPCFKHCRRPTEKCKGYIDNINYPPCTDIKHNTAIVKQLTDIFINHL